MKKRVLSMLMALVMIVSLVPTAFAAELTEAADQPELFADADKQTYYMLEPASGANDLAMSGGIYQLDMTVKGTDPALENATATVNVHQYDETFDMVIAALDEANIPIHPGRDAFLFDVTVTGQDQQNVPLAGATMDVASMWMGDGAEVVPNFDVFLYTADGTARQLTLEDGVYKEDLDGQGNFYGMDNLTIPADAKLLYASRMVPAEPLTPGKIYSVTANLTILGRNNEVVEGLQVYITNPGFPPAEPVSQNGQLTVAKDGTMTLELRTLNPYFCLIDIHDGKDVHVLETVKDTSFRDQAFDEAQLALFPAERIKDITLKLDNTNGFYRFTDCKEFAAPFAGAEGFDANKTMEVDLDIDFASAIPVYTLPEGDVQEYTATYTDPSSGVQLDVRTTNAETGPKLADAKFSAPKLAEGVDGYEEFEYRYQRTFIANPNPEDATEAHSGFDLSLTAADGTALFTGENAGDTMLSVSKIPFSDVGNSAVLFTWGEGEPVKVIAGKGPTGFSVNLDQLTRLMVQHERTYRVFNAASESADKSVALTLFKMDLNEMGKNEIEENGTVGLEARKADTPAGTAYYAGFDQFKSFWDYFWGEMEIPYEASKPYTYFIMEDGTSVYVQEMETWRHGDRIGMKLFNSMKVTDGNDFNRESLTRYDAEWVTRKITAMGNALAGKTPSAETPCAYILSSDQKLAGMPISKGKAQKQTIYSGLSQQSLDYMLGDNAVLSGDTAVDSGSYTMTAVPAEGYTWLDGTRDAKEFPWSIEKHPLALKPLLSVNGIKEGDPLPAVSFETQTSPHNKFWYNLDGFVNGETMETAKDMVPPTVVGMPEASAVKAGESYKITLSGGSAANYELRLADNYGNLYYTTLHILNPEVKVLKAPVGLSPTYTAEEQYGLQEDEASKPFYTLSGNPSGSIVQSGGYYMATASIKAEYKDSYVWDVSGTNAPIEIKWNILPAPLTVTYVSETIHEGETPELELRYDGLLGDDTAGHFHLEAGVLPPAELKPGKYELTPYCIDRMDEYVPSFVPGTLTVLAKGEEGGGNEGGGGTVDPEKPVTKTVTANLYLPGEYNKQVPGLTAYMTNPQNPVEGTGVPTTPVADNAKLKTMPDGTMTLTLKLVNPVFTLQKLGKADNAKLISSKSSRDMAYLPGTDGKYDSRIGEITVELEDKSGEYVFEGSDLFPTLLNTDWKDMPMVLAVKFDGGDDSDLEHGGQVDPGVTPGGNGNQSQENKTSAFTDVPADSYYKEAIDWAVKQNITKGMTETTFSPDTTCTRAQNVTFLWRAAGSPEPKSSVNPFSDVPADAYYAKAVLWAVEKGVTRGTTETTFSPDAPCTRGQTVTFLWRLDGSKQVQGSNPFTDVAADSYCCDAVLWAVKNGITNGKTADTFAPNAPCTRGQIVTFLFRHLAEKD